MKPSHAIIIPLLLSLSTALFTGCSEENNQEDENSEETIFNANPIAAGLDTADLMKLLVEVRTDGIFLTVENQPKDSSLECHLNDEILNPCHDGALFSFPAAGEYSISAIAIKSGKIVSSGDSEPFVVVPEQGQNAGGNQDSSENPLNLVLTDKDFVNYQTHSLEKDFKASWKFFKEPSCDAELQCRYGGKENPFWVDCDEEGKSFSIDKGDLASGLQQLTVQASCDGRRGPELNIFWYGVAEDYQPLMIESVTDNQGKFFFNLVKSNDCAFDSLRFQCSSTTGEGFSTCENGNILENPAPGFRIRASCEGEAGPEIIL